MKWLDNKIKDRVKELFHAFILPYGLSVDNLEKENKELREKLELLKKDLEDEKVLWRKERDDSRHINAVSEQMIRESFFTADAGIYLKIREMQSDSKDELERSLTGMVKILDKRLEVLGDKKGIVTNLLKRIAELEGLVENVHS